MRTFADMRKMIPQSNEIFKRIETLEYHHLEMSQQINRTDCKVDLILTKFENNTPIQGFFFDGQIYDAYTFVADLVRKATRRR